jgi:membrane protein DedA with SNARE-associated domain
MSELFEIFQAWLSTLQAGSSTQLSFLIYPLITLLVAFEGPAVILLSAAAASAGFLNPLYVFIAAAAGNLGADAIWFSLGRLGKQEWLLRIGKRFGVNQPAMDYFVEKLKFEAPKIMFVAKLTNSFIIPALIAAGFARIRWRRWFPALLLAEFILTGSLVVVGYHASARIMQMEKSIALVAMLIAIIFFFFLFLRIQRLFQRSSAYQTILDSSPGDKR